MESSSANETEATLSLMESRRESNSSSMTYKVDREQLERLKNHVRVLESENIDLKRLQPRLVDAQGKDTTEAFAKLARELQAVRDSRDNWENEHRKLSKKYDELEQSAIGQIDARDAELKQIQRKALELEEENSKLREQIQDEQSKIHHLQADQRLDESLSEPQSRDNVVSTLSKIQGMISGHVSGAQMEDASFGELVNDTDHIATHMYMILESLDTNARRTEELQTSIFTFLAERGFNADPRKFAMLSKIYKEAVEKRQRQIRAANDRLLSSSRFANASADIDYEACMRQICMQDSVSLSNTFASFAAMAVNVTQPSMEASAVNNDNVTQPSMEASLAEAGADCQPHNITVESMSAVNTLAGRTSNLAEACIRMFEKLRGTAEFFQQMLKSIGVSEEELGEELMQKIEAMKLDLDKSMGEARAIMVESRAAERNLRTVLFEQSIMANSTVYTSIENESNTSGLQQQQQAAVTTEPQQQMPQEPCPKCQDMEGLYQTTKSTLNAELEKKEGLGRELAEQMEQNEELKQEMDQLEAKIQELENKVCEKCTELLELYHSAQSTLDTELAEKRELAEKLAEMAKANQKLVEEKENIGTGTGAIDVEQDKENPLRTLLMDGIRDELHKIYDTMSYASSRCSNMAAAAGAEPVSGQKSKLKAGNGSGGKSSANKKREQQQNSQQKPTSSSQQKMKPVEQPSGSQPK